MALETILLAVGPGDADRADELARAVGEVAGPTGATVVLAHVFTDEEFQRARERLNLEVGTAPDEVATRHATIRTIEGALGADDIETEVLSVIGDHGEMIVSLAEETEADWTIVGGRQRSPAGKAVFGSTAQKVLLSAPCPVTFVRGD